MMLDFIEDVNEYGESLVRLYHFDAAEVVKFSDLISTVVITQNQPLDLATIDFIQALNCNLVLRIANEDEGITTEDNQLFYCDLTIQSYKEVIRLIAPFTKVQNGHRLLYDVDTPIDWLFSPKGTWEV